jgi:DNA primase
MDRPHGSWSRERESQHSQPACSNARREPPKPRGDLQVLLKEYQAALPGSPGQAYIDSRRIPLELAQIHGLGFAASGKWAHKTRDWKLGRTVFPHTAADGAVISLYGRAVGSNAEVPKGIRHDHLPGERGYFNGSVLSSGHGPLFITEGTFCALSLIAAGYQRTLAIFGLDGWRWDWARETDHLVFAMDADARGQEAWRRIAWEGRLRGKRVDFLGPEAYSGHKDVNEASLAGTLKVH